MAEDERQASDGGAAGKAAPAQPRQLSPAAKRALEEADERRRLRDEERAKAAKEVGGREGPDPARYGDWEKNGIISDF